MNKRLYEAFEKLKMSDECAEKIRTSLDRPRTQRIHFTPIAIAASLLLVICVFTNSTAANALEMLAENVKNVVSSLVFPDSTAEEQYVFEDGNLVIEKNITSNSNTYHSAVSYTTGSIPSWLEADEDGLYFSGNGERIEIGSLISADIPFTYVMTDANKIKHYIVVGGVYGTGEEPLENVGWAEWMQKPPYDASCWIGGHATRTFDNQAGVYYTWYEVAKDIMNIPWRG